MADLDPDRPCPHEDFAAFVDVARGTDVEDGPMTAVTVEIRVECVACATPLVFYCPDVGLLRDRPAMSPDGLELRAPARPQDREADFGLHVPGFSVRQIEK